MPLTGKPIKKSTATDTKLPSQKEKAIKWGPFTKKFGDTVRDAGVVVVPRVLLTGVANLKLKPIEAIILLQLIACWGGSGAHPCPKRKTLRDWIGCDKRTLDRAIAALVEKKLIEKGKRSKRGRRASNEYDLSGLAEQLKPLGRRAITERKRWQDFQAAAKNA
jgi:DNA-binding MarR family transcriptional regulator